MTVLELSNTSFPKVDAEIDSLFQNALDSSSTTPKTVENKTTTISAPKLLDIVADLKSKSDAKALFIKEEKQKAEAKALAEEEAKQALIEERNASLRKESPERLARTLFVGNIPTTVLTSKTISRLFKQHFEVDSNQIESLRFRSIAVSAEMSKRVAVITGQISETHDTCNAYIVLTPSSTPSALAASTNGSLFEGKHLRVDIVGKNNGSTTEDGADANTAKQHSTKKSVFIGNLSHTIKDESLWESFSSCGPISYVRVIREKGTGKGKGFGYVAFKDRSSIELALKLDGTKCEGRKMRIKRCAKDGYQEKKKAHHEKRANAIKAIKDKVLGKKKDVGDGDGDEDVVGNDNFNTSNNSTAFTKKTDNFTKKTDNFTKRTDNFTKKTYNTSKIKTNTTTKDIDVSSKKLTPQLPPPHPAQKRVGRKPEPLIPKHITEIQKEKVIRANKRLSPPQRKAKDIVGSDDLPKQEHPAALRKKRKDLSSMIEAKRLSVLSKKKKTQ